MVGHGSAASLIVRAFEAGCRILALERDMGGVRSVAQGTDFKSVPTYTRTAAKHDIPENKRIAVVEPGDGAGEAVNPGGQGKFPFSP